MQRVRILLVPVLLSACADRAPVAPPAALEDGVYEVLAVESDAAALPEAGGDDRVLAFEHRFVKGGAEEPVEFVLLHVPGHVALDLAGPPTPGEADGRAVLLLDFRPEAARALEVLTSSARQAAVVIGGEIVTVHRIRVPIEGGKLQVSC